MHARWRLLDGHVDRRIQEPRGFMLALVAQVPQLTQVALTWRVALFAVLTIFVCGRRLGEKLEIVVAHDALMAAR